MPGAARGAPGAGSFPSASVLRGRYVAVEAEDVLRVVAVLEGDEEFVVFGRVGGLCPLGARAVELHEVDVGVAGLEGSRSLGHTGEVGHDPFGHLGREGGPDPVHYESGVAHAHGTQVVGGARQGPAELTELEHAEWRVGTGAGNLYERFDSLGREI